MNERIEQLYEQAHGRKPTMVIDHETGQAVHATFRGEPMYTKDFDPKKFAELIVRECMTTVLKESKWYWDKDEFESSNAIQNAARRLKEHFGVEE